MAWKLQQSQSQSGPKSAFCFLIVRAGSSDIFDITPSHDVVPQLSNCPMDYNLIFYSHKTVTCKFWIHNLVDMIIIFETFY